MARRMPQPLKHVPLHKWGQSRSNIPRAPEMAEQSGALYFLLCQADAKLFAKVAGQGKVYPSAAGCGLKSKGQVLRSPRVWQRVHGQRSGRRCARPTIGRRGACPTIVARWLQSELLLVFQQRDYAFEQATGAAAIDASMVKT